MSVIQMVPLHLVTFFHKIPRISAHRQFGKVNGLGPYNPQKSRGQARINTEHIVKNINILAINAKDSKAKQEILKHIEYLKENLFSFKNERIRLNTALFESGIKIDIFEGQAEKPGANSGNTKI